MEADKALRRGSNILSTDTFVIQICSSHDEC